MIYIDSSVLLAVYLSQARQDIARKWLAKPDSKVSSWLLAVEVPVALRRVLRKQPAEARFVQAALARFDDDLQGIALLEGIAELASRVRNDPRFAECRALDALHAAAALQIREMSGHAVAMATFDDHLAGLAQNVGLGLTSPRD